MLWECLIKPAASSHRMPEHLWQFSTENSGRQQKTWVEHILISQSKMRHGQAKPQVLEILRDMETKHKICKMAPPRPANGEQREDLHGATPLFTLQMKEKPSSPPPHIEKALKSSKVKLVTLQIQNDLLYMQQNIQEVNFKTNLSHYICLAQLQFSFKKIFEKYWNWPEFKYNSFFNRNIINAIKHYTEYIEAKCLLEFFSP